MNRSDLHLNAQFTLDPIGENFLLCPEGGNDSHSLFEGLSVMGLYCRSCSEQPFDNGFAFFHVETAFSLHPIGAKNLHDPQGRQHPLFRHKRGTAGNQHTLVNEGIAEVNNLGDTTSMLDEEQAPRQIRVLVVAAHSLSDRHKVAPSGIAGLPHSGIGIVVSLEDVPRLYPVYGLGSGPHRLYLVGVPDNQRLFRQIEHGQGDIRGQLSGLVYNEQVCIVTFTTQQLGQHIYRGDDAGRQLCHDIEAVGGSFCFFQEIFNEGRLPVVASQHEQS